MANLGSILKQAQQMGSRMQEVQEKLKAVRAKGTSGGGLVEAEVNGLGELLRIAIDPSLIEKQDRELIEDLVPAAVNQAQAKAREHHAGVMQDLTGGLQLPGLEEALGALDQEGVDPKA